MKMILGEESKLAVELIIDDREQNKPLTGYCRIWFGGQFLGSIKEQIFLDGYLLGGFYQMLRSESITYSNFPSNFEDQYNFFNIRISDLNDDQISSYLLNFGTLSDPFGTWSFRHGQNIVIVWKFSTPDGNFVHEDLVNYPNTAQGFEIEYFLLEEFVRRLERLLKAW